MRERAFTLLELLTVVAVIGVLSALLVSAVPMVRARGDATECVSNLRQLVLANLAYVAEHGGQFCPAQDETNRIRWHGVRDGKKFDPEKGPLAPYLGKTKRVKLCPALREVLTGAASFEDGTGGYGYNASYIGGTPDDIYTPETLANVAQPSRTVMFADTAFARADGVQEYPYCEPWVWESPRGYFADPMYASVHFRHHGTANVAWCDGHVTAEEPTRTDGGNFYGGDAKKWSLGWFGPEPRNGYWRPYEE